MFNISTALNHRCRTEPTSNIFQQWLSAMPGLGRAAGGRWEWPGAPQIPAKDRRKAETALKQPFRNQVNFFHEAELEYYLLSASRFRNVIAHHANFFRQMKMMKKTQVAIR